MLVYKGPVYMRIGNPKIPQLFEEKPFQIGKGEVLCEGTDVTIISTGSATLDALKSVDILKDAGVSARLIGLPTVWPLDTALVKQAAIETGKIITVEEHYADGGLGTIITEALSEQTNVAVRRLGMPKAYAVTCGNYRELLRHYHLDAEGIAASVAEWLQ
jgi:transketolase